MKSSKWFLLLFVCFVLALSVSLFGCATTNSTKTVTTVNTGASGASAIGDTITFYSTNTDQDNDVISGLDISSFSITIRPSTSAVSAAQACTISSVTSTTSSRFSLGMTLDRSGSMIDTSTDTPISDLKTAAKSFVDLMDTSDEIAVIDFSTYITVGASMGAATSTNKTAIKTYIDTLTASGSTHLYDAIGESVDQALLGSKTRKAVLAMTDGADGTSTTLTSTTAAIAYANNNGVPVYCVGLGLTSGSSDELNLQSIANGTGGAYYSATDSTTLSTLYNKIAGALSNVNTVVITSPINLVTGTQYVVTVTVTINGVSDSVSFTITI